MGWCSGGEISDSLWLTVVDLIPEDKRVEVARAWVEIFEGEDCDVMLETLVGEAAGIKTTEKKGSYFPWQKDRYGHR